MAAAWLLDDEDEALSNAALAQLETEEALARTSHATGHMPDWSP